MATRRDSQRDPFKAQSVVEELEGRVDVLRGNLRWSNNMVDSAREQEKQGLEEAARTNRLIAEYESLIELAKKAV